MNSNVNLPIPQGNDTDPADPLFFPQSFFQTSWKKLNDILRNFDRRITTIGASKIAFVYKIGDQTFSAGFNKIALDTVIADTYNMFDATNHQLVARVEGWYDMMGSIDFSDAATAGDVHETYVEVNGTIENSMPIVAINTTSEIVAVTSMIPVHLAVGDVVELYGARGGAGKSFGTKRTSLYLRYVGR